ncbi:MAG: C4-dicarboxylate ABC transporter permease [Betaproteobacteria bacterium RIFCSPLOWO2_12_FULL_62_13b]|nr:MAG: C4-dicarboxylate ABC transporter permease [Betaproteobacteria bacterium RIFCSPLOWO2_12_FULL_62_13b]
MLASLTLTFIFTMAIGVPIAFCLGLAGLIALVVWGKVSLVIIPQRMFTGVDSFVLMAVPFFILAGELMGTSGILGRLIRFADLLVGWIRGGLAHVNIVASMIFAGVSGSAVADASALGSALIPSMREEYDNEFASAVCAGAAIIGPIIPPSIPMVVYALTANVSIAGLFLAGVIPGILMGLGMMGIAYVIARRRGYSRRTEKIPWPEIRGRTLKVIPAVVMPGIILGGILLGVVTPTEAGALAVLYAVLVGFFVTKELRWSHFPHALLRSGIATAIVFILVATSNVVSWLLSAGGVPQMLGALVRSVSSSPWVFLLMVNIVLLILGCLLDNLAIMIMVAPILAPIAGTYGIHPLHFGFVFVLNGVLGLLTPPFGMLLFVVSAIAKIPLMTLARAVFPFLVWQLVVLFLATYIPAVAMWVPKMFGYF